ncbi:MAG: acetyl-CoA C-acyltransferase FadI [Gemmatimonadetes bacterium RIFCSPLOWO2_02_FULL_71_11]|nr:MAG: acetyl-CoA C-acyltransferase FadI [Gemmatimonadetes bacterium RIFCSPLOWO2_02_FULL_71_11]
MTTGVNGRRVAVVAGCRTPFAKAGTVFKDVSAVELARHATRELLERTEIDPGIVDQVVFGQVVPSVLVPNVAREVSLLPQFPRTIPAYSLNRACASSGQAVAEAHDQIALGQADVVIAGGVEALSDIPILHSRRFAALLVEASRAKTLGQRLGTLARTRPRDLVPVTPAIAEPSTGESMGQSAEKMAKENGISRAAQDEYAVRSHQLAAKGTADGRLTAEIAPFFLPPTYEQVETSDNGIRADTTLEQVAKLRPVFDRRYGTVTAASASPLTDGASAVLVMSAEKATALGYEPLAYVRAYAVAAVDPGEQLLMGPAFAVPKALARAGLAWEELGLVEMHEAFAAQVLSNIQAFESKKFAQEKLGRSEAVGAVNWDTLNVMGGSVAIGHPFGATGGRIITTLANEMKRRDVQFGLISVCAQGGMGFAMILERR